MKNANPSTVEQELRDKLRLMWLEFFAKPKKSYGSFIKNQHISLSEELDKIIEENPL